MESLEQLLPGIDDYLSNVLAKEQLSVAAENKRLYFVELLDVLKMPPSLPPRPEGLSKGILPHALQKTAKSDILDEGYLFQQRELSRAQAPQNLVNGHRKIDIPQNEPTEEIGGEYDDVDDIPGRYGDGDGDSIDASPYETPQVQEPYWSGLDGRMSGASGSKKQEDEESLTSYESYDDEAPEAANQNLTPHSSRDDIPLPRKKSKKKKVKQDLTPKNLLNVSHCGELYSNQVLFMMNWTKRFCLISDHRLMCYKSEKDSKPVLNIPLLGYDIVYLEKEGKYSNVIRISHPGCDTYLFSADCKEACNVWIDHLSAASSGRSISTTDISLSEKSLSRDGFAITSTDQQTLEQQSSLSSSEGGSGDGVMGKTITPISGQPDDKKKLTEDKKKFSISNLLTFGKKKGQKIRKDAIEMLENEKDLDPNASAIGFLNVSVDLATAQKWSRRWCILKTGMLFCYKDPMDDSAEYALPVGGLDIQLADKETKKSLAIKLVHDERIKMYLEAADKLEHGRWLTALIQETGCSDLAMTSYDYISDDRQLIVDDEFDEIYDEVYDIARCKIDKMEQSNKVTQEKESERHSASDSDSIGGTRVPPPLPKTPPPKMVALKLRKQIKSSTSETSDVFDDSLSYPGSYVNIEDEVNSTFNIIKSRVEGEPATKKVVATVTTTPTKVITTRVCRANVINKNKPKKTKLTSDRSSTTSEPDQGDVVKGHIGATIDEDRELLGMTQNPILTELRKERGKKPDALEKQKVDERIVELKRRVSDIKKKRGEVRSQKVVAKRAAEVKDCEEKLQIFDKDLEETDQELAKLILLSQEKEGAQLSRNSSFRSTSSSDSKPCSRSSSIGASTPVTKTKNPTSASSSPSSSTTSLDQKQNSSPSTNKTGAIKSASLPKTNQITAVSISSSSRAISGRKTTSTNGNSTNTVTTSAVKTKQKPLRGATKAAIAKWDTTAKENIAMAASARTAKKNGPSNKTAAPSISSTAVPKTRHQKSATTTTTRTTNSPNKMSPKSSALQDRLKLWEAMGDDSTA